ncbi:MAG: RluA family pseudouridine synthase [Planctomycetes bacterium]|nr:RluA family pseudouridine synthase [Planctomycetota bacterium]
MVYHLPIPPERAGMELDEFLCLSFPLLNKGFLRRQVREGHVLVDGALALPSQRLRADTVLVIDFEEEGDLPEAPVAPATQVPVLYEDEHVLAVDKPAGLAAEPERWAKGNASLAGALLELAFERTGSAPEDPTAPATPLSFRPRLLHRLDKDTTGVVLVAKDVEAERVLREGFETGTIHKTYLALVEGEYPLDDDASEIIDLPIGPDERKSGRMRIDANHGKEARTRVSVAQRFHGYTLVRAEPLTGRTHQIRVHLREMGFPLVVDAFYGRRKAFALSDFKRDYRRKPGAVEAPLIDRLTLHAARIEFPEPLPPAGAAPRTIAVESPIPKDLARVLKQLAKFRPR